ncbi:Npun_F0813 family protein [Leptolyngbya sp. FACHB-17]|uniref:Npun_F0813 family protein n=1 Tax=unclassified Leptolyngbya TaxID=2650499 RepID=UPI001680FFCC|nr:Npun_F0813 family protein [Leptolyngbya sp. FACHB-17]MBD2079536.1 hypothetical protein [Leptolyngbya sp. FACHB-17]
MFILKRQDVEISSIQHPKRDQKVPILSYQGQSFRLIQVFGSGQEEEARSFWRDLTDNQGKACVLLEEPERCSVWGKVRLEQLSQDAAVPNGGGTVTAVFTQACLLMLQAMYIDVEDLMGTKQAASFERDLISIFQQWRFPQTDSPAAVKQLLTINPLNSLQTPAWQENLLNVLLQELYRLGKAYFGKSAFADRVLDALQDLPQGERTRFLEWLNHSPTGKLWS